MLRSYSLQNKLALITGAAGLLGQQHAYALLECGADVLLTDINEAELEKIQKKILNQFPEANIYIKPMDVTNLSSIKSVLEYVLSNYEQINILINNAAIDYKVNEKLDGLNESRLENFSLEQWNFQVSVGLTGAFLCSQVFGVDMVEKKGGVILNIASDLSIIAPDQRLYRKEGLADSAQAVKPVTYSVIKTGLIGLTRYLAAYWADKNVRVNALSPGGVYNGQNENFVKRLWELIPMKRMASVEEYRGAIQFLCSDASKYMTGQNIVIDGGRSIL